MTNVQITVMAEELYKELFKIQESSGRQVDTHKRNTTIETELVVLSQVDAEILELEPNKPYIQVSVGLSSMRGKIAKRSTYFETLEDANHFVSYFDEVVK